MPLHFQAPSLSGQPYRTRAEEWERGHCCECPTAPKQASLSWQQSQSLPDWVGVEWEVWHRTFIFSLGTGRLGHCLVPWGQVPSLRRTATALFACSRQSDLFCLPCDVRLPSSCAGTPPCWPAVEPPLQCLISAVTPGQILLTDGSTDNILHLFRWVVPTSVDGPTYYQPKEPNSFYPGCLSHQSWGSCDSLHVRLHESLSGRSL